MSEQFQEIFGLDLQADLQLSGSSGESGQLVMSQGPGATPVWATINGAVVDKLVGATYDEQSHVLTLSSADGSEVTVQLTNFPEPDNIVSASVSPDGLITLTKSDGSTVTAQITFPDSSETGAVSFYYNSVDQGIGPAMVHTVSHNLDAAHPAVTVYRLDGPSPNTVVQPSRIVMVNNNTLTIHFPVSIACACTIVA